MTWSVFAWLLAQLEPPLLSTVDAMSGAMVSYVRPALQWGLIAYMAGKMLLMAIKPGREEMAEWETTLLLFAVVFFVAANVSGYTTYVRTLFLTTLPNDLGSAITGASGNVPLSGALFDGIWNKAWAAGLLAYRNLPFSVKAIVLGVVIILFWGVALIATAVEFFVWFGSRVVLALLIGVGPLFVALAAFPFLRRIFERWLGAVLSCILLQVFSVALLTLVVGAENKLIAMMTTTASDNPIAQLQMLFGGILLFVVCALIAKRLPGLAEAIGGGVAFEAMAIGRTAQGAVMGAAVGGVAGAAAGAMAATKGATQAIRARMNPAGKSMSDNA